MTIPVVFVSGAEPVQGGLVTSLNRPTGNLTGISVFHGELGAKRLELLRELVPTTSVIGYLLNPENPNSEPHSGEVHAAARTVTQQILLVKASSEKEIDAAFETFAQGGVGALLIGDDPFFGAQRNQLIALAAQRAMPTMYFYRHFAIGGGLISYGMNLEDQWRQTGIYTGRLLKGEKPADLPVLQPSKLELVINVRTAKALGLTIPPTLLARADELIE
jgi:putative tryptophan/tyrosine transport system substrate-binding protein